MCVSECVCASVCVSVCVVYICVCMCVCVSVCDVCVCVCMCVCVCDNSYPSKVDSRHHASPWLVLQVHLIYQPSHEALF